MIGRALMLVFWAMLATPVLSQAVPIRSGEHDGFTRLALDMPAEMKWETQTHENRLSLLFTNEDIRFDTEDVFRRLTDNRLTAISGDKGRLDISLACDCRVEFFWHMKTMLVIDIHDKLIDKNEARVTRSERQEQSIKSILETVSPAAMMLADAMPDQIPNTEGTVVSRQAVPRLHDMRDHILASMREAADQGVLEPSEARATPQADSNATLAANPDIKRHHDTRSDNQLSNVKITLPGQMSRPGTATSAADNRLPTCLPDSLTNVAAWGDDTSFVLQLGRLNRQLVQEFDIINPRVALDLARLYIRSGFGIEAGQVISISKRSTEGFDILKELAEIVDNLHLDAPGRLHEDLGCSGSSAVWAVMAHESLPQDQILDTSAILRSFYGLPRPLRRHFGPELSRRLVSAGHRKTADVVLRADRYANPSQTPGRGLALAELDIAGGQMADATAALSSDMIRNTKQGAEAALLLVEHHLQQKHTVSYDEAQLVGAFYQQHREDRLAPRLARAYVLGLAASGAFAEAMADYTRLEPSLHETVSHAIMSELTDFVTKDAQDIIFLRHALKISPDNYARLPSETVIPVAERMLDLGFLVEARRIIETLPQSESNTPNRALWARLELDSGNPQFVETLLRGISGPEVSQLKARAKSEMGDYRSAETFFIDGNDIANAQRAAWLGLNWNNLIDADDPRWKRLAEVVTQDLRPDIGILQRSRALIAQSADTREALKGLLGDQDWPKD